MSERLYYSDSFLRSFTAKVADTRRRARADDEPFWQLSLDRSAFYPTSGGQPFDTGLLTAKSPAGSLLEVRVEEVEEDEQGQVWHLVREPLAIGTDIQASIDWERRFDHMQQHTGQHLLSAVFLRELNAPTVSFHLGETTATIDLACAPPARHSLERIERIANEIIGEDRRVAPLFVERREAEELLAAGKLRKLPERDGTIRLIEIADCDLNACGGTHVKSTGQIGGLLLRGTEKVSRGVRIEFVCGLRAVKAARRDFAILTETGALLSSGAADLPALVSRMQTDAKAAARERQKLREELAGFEATSLAKEAPIANGLRLVEHSWKDRDRDYLRLLASRVAAATPATAVIFIARESDPARIFLARSKDLSFDCGRILREALASFGLRGGGSPDLAQGDVPFQHEETLRSSLRGAILGVTAAH